MDFGFVPQLVAQRADEFRVFGKLLHQNTASTKSEEIVSAAIQQAKQEKKQILAQADKEAAAVKQRAQEQIEAERREMYASMKKEMVDVAFSAAGKLIGEHEGEKVDRQAIDAFVKETVGNGE